MPCLEDDLRLVEEELSCLFFFLSLLLVSDETSGEPLAALLPVAEILKNSLVQGGFEAVEDCSTSDSSEEPSVPEVFSGLGQDSSSSPRQLCQEYSLLQKLHLPVEELVPMDMSGKTEAHRRIQGINHQLSILLNILNIIVSWQTPL